MTSVSSDSRKSSLKMFKVTFLFIICALEALAKPQQYPLTPYQQTGSNPSLAPLPYSNYQPTPGQYSSFPRHSGIHQPLPTPGYQSQYPVELQQPGYGYSPQSFNAGYDYAKPPLFNIQRDTYRLPYELNNGYLSSGYNNYNSGYRQPPFGSYYPRQPIDGYQNLNYGVGSGGFGYGVPFRPPYQGAGLISPYDQQPYGRPLSYDANLAYGPLLPNILEDPFNSPYYRDPVQNLYKSNLRGNTRGPIDILEDTKDNNYLSVAGTENTPFSSPVKQFS